MIANMKICSKGLLNLHLSKRDKTGTRTSDEPTVVQDPEDHDDSQSLTASVVLAGKEPVEADADEAKTSNCKRNDREVPAHYERPALRRETRSHGPVRRPPARHYSDGDGPVRRPVPRQSSSRTLSVHEDAAAAAAAIQSRPSIARTSSSRSSAGSSRLHVVRRTSSRTLARDHASCRSLASCSSHEASRQAPSRSVSNDTLASVDSCMRNVPSSNDNHDDDASLAKYEYETMSGLEYGTTEPEPTAAVVRRRHPQHIPGRQHPTRRPGSGRAPPSRTSSSSSLERECAEARRIMSSSSHDNAESIRRLERASRARRSTPTTHKLSTAASARRKKQSNNDSHTTWGSTSTEEDTSSPKSLGDPLGSYSYHESMSNVMLGLDELDSMLLGSSIHTTVSCAY